MGIKARYLGDGAVFHGGIPARDLTDAEFAALTPEQQRLVEESPIYAVTPAPKPANTETPVAPAEGGN